MDKILEKWDEILLDRQDMSTTSATLSFDTLDFVPLEVYGVDWAAPHISLSRPSSWDSAIFPRNIICRSK